TRRARARCVAMRMRSIIGTTHFLLLRYPRPDRRHATEHLRFAAAKMDDQRLGETQAQAVIVHGLLYLGCRGEDAFGVGADERPRLFDFGFAHCLPLSAAVPCCTCVWRKRLGNWLMSDQCPKTMPSPSPNWARQTMKSGSSFRASVSVNQSCNMDCG